MPVAIHDHLRALASGPAAELDRLNDIAWRSTDPNVLELCRLRIAQMLGDTRGVARRTPGTTVTQAQIDAVENWWSSDLFNSFEQARIAFTEQFVTSVSSMSDDDVAALLVDEDAVAVYRFATAIYVIDLTTRMDMVTRAVFDDEPAISRQTPGEPA